MEEDARPKFPAVDTTLRTRHLVITRPTTPQVTQMLADVYDILGNQIGMMRNRAQINELDSKEAATLHKYALTLTLLRQEEEKRTQEYGLQGYSDEEIKELVDKSQRLLGNNKQTDKQPDKQTDK